MKAKNETQNVDQYISTFSPAIQKILQAVRTTIKKAAPDAEEVISYKIPAYKYNGVLVYFAGYENHVGFYPTASGIETFKKQLMVYKHAKGSVQFPLDEPMPFDLITKIVQYRLKQNSEAQNKKPPAEFFAAVAAPVRRALENKGIKTVQQLSKFTEAEILALHGIGKTAIPKLREALKKAGLSFKK